jgi:riboflavin synthase
MFSGIIKYTGKIHQIFKKNDNCSIVIFSNVKFSKSEIGSSICCSGVCLTLESFSNKYSKFYISSETMNRTIFKSSFKGQIINLEKSLKFGDRISGHFVQGHVDTTSKVKKISYNGKSWFVNFILNRKLKKYLIYKGSISINGVSLTISKVLKNGFQVVIIPHTIKSTNLINLKNNDFVNIEFDIMGKYIKNYIK